MEMQYCVSSILSCCHIESDSYVIVMNSRFGKNLEPLISSERGSGSYETIHFCS